VAARVILVRRGELLAVFARVMPLRPLRNLRARRLGCGALDERLKLVVGRLLGSIRRFVVLLSVH